jgi:hypothetical protein
MTIYQSCKTAANSHRKSMMELFTNFSEERAAWNFRLEENSQGGVSRVLQDTSTFVPDYTESRLKTVILKTSNLTVRHLLHSVFRLSVTHVINAVVCLLCLEQLVAMRQSCNNSILSTPYLKKSYTYRLSRSSQNFAYMLNFCKTTGLPAQSNMHKH